MAWTYNSYGGTLGTCAYGGGSGGYNLTIHQTLASVPVPGAVWLFGSAVAGFTGLRRRSFTA